jgi:hypothetical protein
MGGFLRKFGRTLVLTDKVVQTKKLHRIFRDWKRAAAAAEQAKNRESAGPVTGRSSSGGKDIVRLTLSGDSSPSSRRAEAYGSSCSTNRTQVTVVGDNELSVVSCLLAVS